MSPKAEAKSVGLNIDLPEEQSCNPYITKSITFNHFFVRKVMLVKYTTAFIIMPGGLGTLDELDLVITTQGKVQQLNRSYRKKDKPTDVLAFSMLSVAGKKRGRLSSLHYTS